MKKQLVLSLMAAGLCSLDATGQTIGNLITNGLSEPYGIAVSGSKFYITDSLNYRVVAYDADSGTLTNFAEPFFDARGIVATRGGVAVADSGDHAIRFVASDGTISLIAGGTMGTNNGAGAAAQFNSPAGLTADSAGNIYVADLLNGAIRKIDTANNVTTLATGLYKPTAVAYDETGGRLFITDTENHSILVLTNGAAAPVLAAGSGSSFQYGTTDSQVGANARFNKPRGLLWVGGATGLLVSDTGNGSIRRVYNTSASNFAAVTYANSSASGMKAPMGLAQDADGNFLVVDLAGNSVWIIQVATPQAPVTEPVIGQVMTTTNSFGQEIYVLVPVQSATYNNDIVVAMVSEDGVETFYNRGADATTLADPTKESFTPPSFVNGSLVSSTTLPPSIVDPAVDGSNVVIKAFSTASGRRPSKVVTAQFRFKVANPYILGRNPGSFTLDCGTEGAELWYTTDGTNPTNNAANAKLYVPGVPLNIVNGSQDVDFRVRAFKAGYASSSTIQQTFYFKDLETSSIGVVRDFNAGIGSTIVVPVQIKLASMDSLRSLQFRVEVTPTGANPAILPQYRALDIDTNDFISVTGPAESGKVATFYSMPYANTNSGVITRGLAISFIGSNANFSVKDLATVAMVAVPIPPTASVGQQYHIAVVQPSGTLDAAQTPVAITPLADRLITITNISYVVGDSAIASGYNAGDFGNGNLNNNDVNNAFYASLGVRTPFSFSDVFDAMDAFPVDSATSVGGDGQIRFLDWQVILLRSLRLDNNNWKRSWSTGGRRAPATATLNNATATPAMSTTYAASDKEWSRQAVIFAQPIEMAEPGATVKVPVYVKVTPGFEVSGLQFRAEVEPVGAAPSLEAPAVFTASTEVTKPITVNGLQEGFPINQTAGAWSLVQNAFSTPVRNIQLLGWVAFTVPATAVKGQYYTIRFLNVDGAKDMTTQYDFESLPAIVWIGTAAQTPAEQISDEYKMRFFGSLTALWAAANADPDGDGVTNLEEYLAGKNPTKLRLHVLGKEWGNVGEGFKVRWFAKQGKQYTIERANTLGQGWTKVTNKLGDGTVQEVQDTGANGAQSQFYRVIEQQ